MALRLVLVHKPLRLIFHWNLWSPKADANLWGPFWYINLSSLFKIENWLSVYQPAGESIRIFNFKALFPEFISSKHFGDLHIHRNLFTFSSISNLDDSNHGVTQDF